MITRENRGVHSEVVGRHAVVLGGSLAGLLAARVLIDHFERVTLIERDAYPETPEVRKGTPQANHVHGLLLRGRQVLEELFPGLQDEMIGAGVPLLDMANDIAWFTRAGWGIRFPSELKVLAFTRPVLDLHGLGDLGRKLNVMSKAGQWSLMPAEVSDDVVRLFAAVGTHKELARAVAARFGGAVDAVGVSGGYGMRQDLPPGLVQDLQRIPSRFEGFRAPW